MFNNIVVWWNYRARNAQSVSYHLGALLAVQSLAVYWHVQTQTPSAI